MCVCEREREREGIVSPVKLGYNAPEDLFPIAL